MIDIQFTGKRKDNGKMMESDSLLRTNFGIVCLWASVGGWTEIEPDSLRQKAKGVAMQPVIEQLQCLQAYCDGNVVPFGQNQSLWLADVEALQTAIDILKRYAS